MFLFGYAEQCLADMQEINFGQMELMALDRTYRERFSWRFVLFSSHQLLYELEHLKVFWASVAFNETHSNSTSVNGHPSVTWSLLQMSRGGGLVHTCRQKIFIELQAQGDEKSTFPATHSCWSVHFSLHIPLVLHCTSR